MCWEMNKNEITKVLFNTGGVDGGVEVFLQNCNICPSSSPNYIK